MIERSDHLSSCTKTTRQKLSLFCPSRPTPTPARLRCVSASCRSSGDRFRIRNQTDENAHKTPMQLWDQGKILKRVVVLRPAPKSSSSFRSETSRFNSYSAPGAFAGHHRFIVRHTSKAYTYCIHQLHILYTSKSISIIRRLHCPHVGCFHHPHMAYPGRRNAPSPTVIELARRRPPADARMNPPATQYVRKDSFDDIVERGTKSKSKPFLSTTDRRDGGAFEVKGTRGIPGPGAYNLAASRTAVPPPRSRAQTGPRLPQGARFGHMGSRNDVGPGSHEISGSLIKKTFNITFGGAYTPAGAGRLVHRASFARKTQDARKFSDAVQLQPAPENLGAKENVSSPQTCFGGRG